MRIGLIPAFPLAGEWIAWRNELLPLHVVRPETEVVYCPVRDGGLLQDSCLLQDSYYETLLFDGYMARAGLEAEAQGIDAIVIDTAERLGLLGLTHSKVAFPAPKRVQDVKLPPLLAYDVASETGR